jgi:hypothetical protein
MFYMQHEKTRQTFVNLESTDRGTRSSMNDKLTDHIDIRVESWMKQAVREMPRAERQNLIEAIRKLIEHAVRLPRDCGGQTSPTPAP